MSRARRLVAAVVTLVMSAAALTACAADTARATQITTSSDITLTASYPDDSPLAADMVSAAALVPAETLMLRPVQLETTETIPANGIVLEATLPAAVPADATVRFAYFDEETGTWAPVATELNGTVVTARTTHLSMWSIFITFGDALWDSVSGDWDAAGAGWAQVGDDIGESWAAWSSQGPGSWVYRNAGVVLGIQGDMPTCEGDWTTEPGLDWVDVALISQLDGIPIENQSVLRCVGVDENDKTKLEIKAVANRGYGFRVEFAPGFSPDVKWGYVENLATADTAVLWEILADGVAGLSVTDPINPFQDLLVGTTEMSFSVSEEEVRAAYETGSPLVSYLRPTEMQMATTVAYKTIIDTMEGELASEYAVVGVALGLRECIGANLPGDWGNAASTAAWIFGCFQSIIDEDYFAAVDTFTSQMAKNKSVTFTPQIEKIFGTKEARTLFGKVLHALKWVDLVTLVLTMTDYWGERTDNAWWVDVRPQELAVPPQPAAGPIDGTWCNIYSECALTVDSTTATITAKDNFSTVKDYVGTYQLVTGTPTFVAGSTGCQEYPLSGDVGQGSSIVACPTGTPYSGLGYPNCGCGMMTDEEIRERFTDQDRLYFVIDFGDWFSVEPYSRQP